MTSTDNGNSFKNKTTQLHPERDISLIEKPTSRRGFLTKGAMGIAIVGSSGLASACGQQQEAANSSDGADDAEKSKTMVENISDQSAMSSDTAFTVDDVASAEKIMGVNYTAAEREQMLASIEGQVNAMLQTRDLKHPNTLAPASKFDPRIPGKSYGTQDGRITLATQVFPALPNDETAIAFAPLKHLSEWVRTQKITSTKLTEIYLNRIKQYQPVLECFVTVTEELALKEAKQADDEIKAGQYRGPLHGIPYAMKDLMDTAGIKTTWGAAPYKDRVPDSDATSIKMLRDAGAVLIGKSTCGALAYGDIWFDGVTKNPWNPLEGSSGSSAGSASATAAGLCGFSIGTETLGSIVSPSHRCGTTGLRPTFGRVSRAGGMTLCPSLDKLGPICRSVEDTILVLQAINGQDFQDPSSLLHGLSYDGDKDLSSLRIGYIPEVFTEEAGATDIDRHVLQTARDLGLNLFELSLPQKPYGILVQILMAEAAAYFDQLTLNNRDDEMVWQEDRAWPNSFRAVRFLSAVDLINMDRFRREVMHTMDDFFSSVDVVIGPNFGGGMLTITNFTGQPQLTFRAGFRDVPARAAYDQKDIDPNQTYRVTHNFSVWAPLFGEGNMVRVANALEAALGVSGETPPQFS